MQLKSKQLCGPKKGRRHVKGKAEGRAQRRQKGTRGEADPHREGMAKLMEMGGPAPGLRWEQESAVHLHSIKTGALPFKLLGRDTDQHSEAGQKPTRTWGMHLSACLPPGSGTSHPLIG